MNSIEPFNFNELIPYNHAYLSGFYAEKYDEEGEKNYNEASERALNSTRTRMKRTASRFSSLTVKKDTLQTKETKRQYALLPVWMVNVKYKGKMYPFAMNGQTGEFIGNIPLDVGKTVLYFFLIFGATFITVILTSIILFVAGGM